VEAADIERSNTYVDRHPLELATASPEDVGLDPALLEAGAENAGLSKAIASMLVIRHGKLVFERYFNGSEASHANSVASLSKSILSLLTGAAIEDGTLRLDTPISEILPADVIPRDDGLTVRHLLTMAGGLEWDEDADSDQFDVRATLSRARASAPGEAFDYSTGLTHVLSAVLTESTGRSTCEYAFDRLFAPLGVSADHWDRGSDGYFVGGDLLWLTPRDIARFGQLVLQRGAWDGRSLIDPGWLEQSLSDAWDFGCPADYRSTAPGSSGYGYLWWRSLAGGRTTWSASGWGGQSLIIAPDLDLAVVVTQYIWPSPPPESVVPIRLFRGFVLPSVRDLPTSTDPDPCPLADIYRIGADGTGETRLTSHAAMDLPYSWSPDGERVAFHSDRDLNFEIYTMAADGSDVRRLTHDFAQDAFAVWSPDGGSIAFASRRDGTSDIYRMRSDGTGLERLARSDTEDDRPTWSPDGTRIAYIRGEVDAGQGGALWSMRADGSDPRRLTDELVEFPAWSPDGARIAFGIRADGESTVGVLDLATGTVTALGPGTLPRWAPDGTRLAVSTIGLSEIVILGISDRTRTTLTRGVVPIWSPDGDWIVFGRS
jgi:Tol biopolymer transport system component/CubicO group peptidase (beta-lactamase class C family)